MEDIKVLKAHKGNAQFLYELMNDKSVLTALNEIPTTLEIWADAITEWVQDADEEDYIICDEHIPIGWLGINGLSGTEKIAYIKIIALLPEYQNSSIGQYAVNKIIEGLKLQGYASIRLYTDKSNIQAQKCYSKCGFKVIDIIEQKMSNGAVVERYIMERSLNENLREA